MIPLQHKRRSFLLGLAGLGISLPFLQGGTQAQAATPQGYVLGPAGANIWFIFAIPVTSSSM